MRCQECTCARPRRYNRRVPRIAVLSFTILLSLAALAQKKLVTIDAITAERNVPRSAPVQWAPDGRRFAWLEEKELWLYDVAARREKQLANLADLDAKAVKSAAADAFDWRNRHLSKQLFAWSDSGKEILISTSGDLFLLHPDTGKWDQLTATAEADIAYSSSRFQPMNQAMPSPRVAYV